MIKCSISSYLHALVIQGKLAILNHMTVLNFSTETNGHVCDAAFLPGLGGQVKMRLMEV